ncbi:MAG TPA: LOG family protein [Candidatus Udaeobacter sp.]|jgi:uncharacterized protein (TIGR00730 family)|nr:LOG family protein [Candidatus Udaeobacter sp.]
MKRPLIAVYGSSTIRETDSEYRLALDLGRALARGGADVMTGGYGGAMEACSRGCHESGGHVVGVTVELFEARGPANRWVKERVHTSDLYERLKHIVERADGFIAVPGSVGTLTEIFLTWTLLSVSARRSAPLVLCGAPWEDYLEHHRRPDLVRPDLFTFVRATPDPEEAARLVLDAVAAPRP